MRSDLTPDQRKLADAMSKISEEAYAAGWMSRLEFSLWHLLVSGGVTYGRATITKEALENLRALSRKCGGWIVFDDEKEETFVSLADWERRFSSESTATDGKA